MKYKTIILLFSLILFSVGCREQKKSRPKFGIGETVVAKLGNKKGMVVDYRQEMNFIGGGLRFYYIVRFANNGAITNTKLLTKDREISYSPYADMKMREFELKKATDDE